MLPLLENIMAVIPPSLPLPWEDGYKSKFNSGRSTNPWFTFGSIKL
jgi:hypothetical protein